MPFGSRRTEAGNAPHEVVGVHRSGRLLGEEEEGGPLFRARPKVMQNMGSRQPRSPGGSLEESPRATEHVVYRPYTQTELVKVAEGLCKLKKTKLVELGR